MGAVRQNPIQRTVKLIKKLCSYIMLHDTTVHNGTVLLTFPLTPHQHNSNVAVEVNNATSRPDIDYCHLTRLITTAVTG